MDHHSEMTDAIRQRIAAGGPIPFAEFQSLALYGPGGFFSHSHVADRSGHFMTSPSLGSVFARVVGRAMDEWWSSLDCPEVFDFIECGGADGRLAQAILQLDLQCKNALRYTVVERSPTAISRLREVNGVEVAEAFPADPVEGVVFANELLDNIPVRLLEQGPNGWLEVFVDLVNGEFCELLMPARPGMFVEGNFATGARIPFFGEAAQWLADALGSLHKGRVVCVDYVRPTVEFVTLPQGDWLRTFRSHHPGRHPLFQPGSQDITCDVALDQLERVCKPSRRWTQADFFSHYGIGDMRADYERTREAVAPAGGIEALLAQARLAEIAALTDPAGMGGFEVMEWEVR